MKTDPPPPAHRPPRPPAPTQPHLQRKVFDIARPGRTPASSTSRPIIVGHSPSVQDHSVTVNAPSGEHTLLDPHKTVTPPEVNGLEQPDPVSQAQAPASAMSHVAAPIAPPVISPGAPAAPAQAAPQPQSVSASAEAQAIPTPSPVEPLNSESPPPVAPAPHEPVPPSSAPLASPVSSVAAAPQADELPEDLPAPDIEEEEPVVISKHVPHDHSSKWRLIVTLSVAVLIMLIIFDILLDADFITIKVLPHTHFF
jgi:hypothetical protein